MNQNDSPDTFGNNTLQFIDTYKKILEKCFQVHISSIKFIGGGSYRVFEVDNLIFKFTHEGPANFLEREKDTCELLKEKLSISIPYFIYFSDTCPSFKGAVGGYKKLEGESLYKISTCNKMKTAHQIGQCLSELHAVPLNEEFNHQKARKELREFYHRIQKNAFHLLNKTEQQWTASLFENFLKNNENWRFSPVFVHGDFDSSNILYHPDKGVCGIIDFEEAGPGDPAWDFCTFLDEYGPDFLHIILHSYNNDKVTDHLFLDRISFHAKRIIFCELLYGIEYNQPEHTKHGLIRLKKAIENQITGGWLYQQHR